MTSPAMSIDMHVTERKWHAKVQRFGREMHDVKSYVFARAFCFACEQFIEIYLEGDTHPLNRHVWLREIDLLRGRLQRNASASRHTIAR